MSLVSNLEEKVSKIFSKDSEEFEVLLETYRLINRSTPLTSADAKNYLINLDHLRVKLSSIYYLISSRVTERKLTTQSTYDNLYVQLVRRGRPSKDAIESEIRELNPEIAGIFYQNCELEDIKSLVEYFLRCIDSSRLTTIELLRSINRID